MKRTIIIGGGNSVSEGIEKDLWDKIKDQEIWSLNSVFKVMPYLPSKEIWVDIKFYEREVVNLQKLHEKGVELIAKTHIKTKFLDKEITQYNTSREEKNYYGKDALKHNIIYYGRMGLSGHFALSLAIAKGYQEIFLLGYDFGSPSLNDKKTHFYEDQIPALNIFSTGAGRPEVYFLKKDGKVRRELKDWEINSKEKDIKIYNVSMISNIPYFEKINYEQFFEKINYDRTS